MTPKPDPDKDPKPSEAKAQGGFRPVPPAKKKAGEEPRWQANLKTIGGAVVLAMFIRVVLFEAFEIEGPSMMPTLLNGDRVVVAKFAYGLFLPFTDEAVVNWGTPSVGSVVIVKSPQDGIDIVKRVVGVPGDTIELRDDVVWRNGHAIPTRQVGSCDYPSPMGQAEHDANTEPGCIIVEEELDGYVYRISRVLGGAGSIGPWRVPPGQVFILGDHRDHSNDSRFFGPVPVERVKGRALAMYWSSDRQVEEENGTPTETWFTRWGRLFHAVD